MHPSPVPVRTAIARPLHHHEAELSSHGDASFAFCGSTRAASRGNNFSANPGKDRAAFLAVEFRAGFDLKAASDRQIPAKIRIIGTEQHLAHANH